MNFVKWFLYLVALGAFIWFVFFRKFNDKVSQLFQNNPTEITQELDNSSIDSESADEEDFYQDTDPSSDDYETNNSTNDAEIAAESEPAVESDSYDDTNYTESEPDINSSSGSIDLSNKYLVVVGSFGSKANANRLIATVNKNYPDAVTKKINGLHRVVIGSETNEQSAESVMSSYKSTYDMPAFVLAQ